MTRLDDASKLVIIDYEYGGWNPAAFDLGNYLCEMALDNNHPYGKGIKLYMENHPSEEEIDQVCKWYLENWHAATGEGDLESFFAARKDKFGREVRQCMLLACWYWGVWALSMLPDSEVCNESAFNIEYSAMRAKQYDYLKKRFSF